MTKSASIPLTNEIVDIAVRSVEADLKDSAVVPASLLNRIIRSALRVALPRMVVTLGEPLGWMLIDRTTDTNFNPADQFNPEFPITRNRKIADTWAKAGLKCIPVYAIVTTEETKQ